MVVIGDGYDLAQVDIGRVLAPLGGPTPFAFTVRETFPAPDATERDPVVRGQTGCGVD